MMDNAEIKELMTDAGVYCILCNENTYVELGKRYFVNDVEYILSSGIKMLKTFDIKDEDENILSAFLLYFLSARAKVDSPIDLSQARKLSDLDTALILKDLLTNKETDKTDPIKITIHNDKRLKSYLNNRNINFISS